MRWYTLRKFFGGAYPPLCIVRFSGATLIEDVEADRGVRVVETLNAYLFHNGITTTRKQACAARKAASVWAVLGAREKISPR